MIRVIAVTPSEDYTLTLRFSNGEERVFNASPYLDIGVFTELRDINYFQQVRIAFGTVQWPHEQDFAPETLYAESRSLAPAR
jgi:hypothetical protein